MTGRAAGIARAAWIAGALGACDDTSRKQAPPPEGYPWLADRYAVQVELLGSSCAPGGLIASARAAVADVIQDGELVEWAQRSEAPDAETLFLDGTLCPSDEGTVIRLIGERRDTVAGCQVITDVPPPDAGNPTTDCDPTGQVSLSVDECGIVTGIIDMELRYALACIHRSPCRLTVRVVARPTAFDSRAPKLPGACL